MKKRIFTVIIGCVLCAALVTGCAKAGGRKHSKHYPKDNLEYTYSDQEYGCEISYPDYGNEYVAMLEEGGIDTSKYYGTAIKALGDNRFGVVFKSDNPTYDTGFESCPMSSEEVQAAMSYLEDCKARYLEEVNNGTAKEVDLDGDGNFDPQEAKICGTFKYSDDAAFTGFIVFE